MTKSIQKIALSQSRDIPFDTLRLSYANVRHVQAGVPTDELAADIARRTVLTALTVRPLFDDAGAQTDHDEISTVGDVRARSSCSSKQKRLMKTAPIPCVIRTDGIAEEDKLRAVEKIIQGPDFTCVPEGMDAVEAWLGSSPPPSCVWEASVNSACASSMKGSVPGRRAGRGRDRSGHVRTGSA